MNRRQLFFSTAKAALATALSGPWLGRAAKAQAQTGGAASVGWGRRSSGFFGQVTGTPGMPGTTTTIDGRYLPAPPQPFLGHIEPNAAESTAAWPLLTAPPKGAPNVLLIMIDDEGFGAPSTFGGLIPTPTMDRIAKMGLTYTRFHTTSLCSPTRGALLTGRNHHSVGYGTLADTATGYPGYNSVIPLDSIAVGQMLRENGYRTAWFGKDHNVPLWEASQAGPFDQWPTGPVKGFDYYYGFVGDDTSQWAPGNLFRNTTPIQPYLGKPGWNLITAMADEAIDYINMVNAIQPERPFMLYYAPGATHAPHHPTPEWVQKITDMHLFDEGYQKVREKIFANQKRLGVIPQDAKLNLWPATLTPWDQLDAEAKRLFIKQINVYAAYLAYVDYETGRVVQAIEDMGKLDNTLIIYIAGDNGASPEGQTNGLYNEVALVNGLTPTVAENMRFYDVWGTDQTYPHYTASWAQTLDAPYQYTKQVASHFGGTRNGMVMSWPAIIKDAGGKRHQFHHVIDIVPTILEACGLPQPAMMNGIAQKPIEGVSMAYTWDNANAQGRRETQYFEMFASRAIYHQGWIASDPPLSPPWVIINPRTTADPMNDFPPWELYDLTKDWTQADDLAARMPDKLRDMKELFTVEASKYNVFPLDDARVPRFFGPKPSYAPDRTEFTYVAAIANVPTGVGGAPDPLNRSYTITAEITVPEGGADGMIVTDGGRFSGYAFYLLKGKPMFAWNVLQLEQVKWQGKDALTPGKHILVFDFKYDGPGMGKGGSGVLTVDGRDVDRRSMARTLPGELPWFETFNIGNATAPPVVDDYQVPFPFAGRISKLTVKLGPLQLTPDERKLIGLMRSASQ
jgi:arylsulfatase